MLPNRVSSIEVGNTIETTQGVWEVLRVESGFCLLSAPTGAPASESTRKWVSMQDVEATRIKYALCYSHRHGTDTYILDDEDAAYRAACNIIIDIIEWWSELRKPAQDSIRALLESGNYQEAVAEWDSWSDESITIERALPGDASVPQVPPREE